MKTINRTFLFVVLLISPSLVFGADVNVGALRKKILDSKTISEATSNLKDAKNQIESDSKYAKVNKDSAETKIQNAITNVGKNVSFSGDPKNTRNQDEKAAALQEKQDAYDEAKANEQSLANRALTAVTTAATGIGGMELAMGLSEQSADINAEQSMAAYIETMRCTYADGKQVKAGPQEIELPGAYNENLAKYRQEYFALASDLKERKNALGMLPGIEVEEILDKSSLGLYDDENVGIEKGAYESLYRAQMLGSETDQEKIDAAAEASKKRVMGGAIAAGAGAVVGVVGNVLINKSEIKKWSNEIKNKKACKEINAFLKNEEKALDKIKQCLRYAEYQETEKIEFEDFYASVLNFDSFGFKCHNDGKIIKKEERIGLLSAENVFNPYYFDKLHPENAYEHLKEYFSAEAIGTMLGLNDITETNINDEETKTKIINQIKTLLESTDQRLDEAIEKDKANGCDVNEIMK